MYVYICIYIFSYTREYSFRYYEQTNFPTICLNQHIFHPRQRSVSKQAYNYTPTPAYTHLCTRVYTSSHAHAHTQKNSGNCVLPGRCSRMYLDFHDRIAQEREHDLYLVGGSIVFYMSDMEMQWFASNQGTKSAHPSPPPLKERVVNVLPIGFSNLF